MLNITQLHHFLAMGGYADYVWSAYGSAAAMILVQLIYSFLLRRQTKKRLARWWRLNAS